MKTCKLLSQKFNASNSVEQFREMQDFILLWMIFEKDVLTIKNESRKGDGVHGRQKNVSDELKSLANHLAVSDINKDLLDAVFDKLKSWYFSSMNATNVFTLFKMNSDQRKVVTKAFIDGKASDEERLQAVITVIYKYRCNFIHGVKELFDLHVRQHERFSLYSKMLVECINAKK